MAPTCRDDPVAAGDTNYVLNKTVIRQSDEKNLPGHLDPLSSYSEQVTVILYYLKFFIMSVTKQLFSLNALLFFCTVFRIGICFIPIRVQAKI